MRSCSTHFSDALVSSVLACLLFLTVSMGTACVRNSSVSRTASPTGEWHEFQGTWTATGNRDTLGLQGSRKSSISNFKGALVLAGPSRPGIGFRSDAIIFNDSETGLVGRSVWIDEHGDRVYSELRSAGPVATDKIVGTFVGGTGRYSGATGNYAFSWRFVFENEDGVVQGQSSNLAGRIMVENRVSSLVRRSR